MGVTPTDTSSLGCDQPPGAVILFISPVYDTLTRVLSGVVTTVLKL